MNLVLFDQRQDAYHLPRGDERAHHIRRILRAVAGDTIRVGVVGGARGFATLVETSEAGLTLRATWEQDRSDSLPVTVVLGHPRPPVLQRLLRDLAALRVSEIHVFVGALSEASYLGSSLWDRTDQVIRDGLSQGMHTAPPALYRWKSLSAALQGVEERAQVSGSAVHRIYGAVNPPAEMLPQFLLRLQNADAPGRAVVAIGPERGFTADEERHLVDHHFSAVHLGTSTLRTETATIILAGAVCASLS